MNLKLKHFFIIFLILLLAIQVQADAPDVYLPITPSDPSLSATVFATNGTATMDVNFIDGRLHVSDSVHGVKGLRVLNSVIYRLKSYNGKEVMLYHVNDVGVKDSSRLVPIQSDGTWTYFYDVEFSEVIIDGFVGTWEVTAYNLSMSDSLNIGQTLNASNVTSLPVNVTDDATKSHPYDINYTGCVLEWRADGDFNDTQGVNTLTGYDVTFDDGKYNETGVFNSSNLSHVNCENNESLNITNAITIEAWMKGTGQNVSYAGIVDKNAQSNGYLLRVSSNVVKFFLRHPDASPAHKMIQADDTLPVGEWTHCVAVRDTNNYMWLYINGVLQTDTADFPYSLNTSANNLIIGKYSSDYFNGSIDSVRIYNRALSAEEIKHNYYDNLQQLKIKTNSNSTWSTEWNSTADNPIQVPYADGEFFSLLNFTVPDSVVQNGITIYDYPSTVQFDAITTVGYTEDITKITESAAAGTYTLNVTHAANNTGEGYINYTTTNNVLLDADFWNAAVLTTDNPNASLSTTLPNFNISTGYVAAATEYYYLVEMPYFYPPTNIQTTPSQCCVNITWDAVPNADNYSVYELEDGFSYVNTNPIVDGVKDAIYNYSHEFLIFSPNPVNPGDYETIYPLRTSLGAYFLIESVDNDNKLGDDDAIYYFDLDNDGLTVDDPAWKITNNIIKKYLWDGATWKVTGVSSAVGASTGGGTHYPIHELFIPIAELGANWTNGSTVKVLVKREDSSLTPDVVRWYPYGNINDTDTSLWQEMVLNDLESYTFLNNTTNLWYNATGLTPFTIYHGAVSAWNGSQETSYALFDVITDDIPFYNVSGYIKNQDGYPLPDITVYSCNCFISEITTTNESGFWIGYAFREGNYTVCANHTCYISDSIDIYVTDNMTNQNITLNNVIINNCELMEKLLEIEDAIDDLSTDFTPTEGNYEMLSSTYNIFLLLLGACFILAFPKRGEVTERDTGLNNVLFSFLGTILSVFLAQIIVSGQVVESFAFESQIYDPLQHYFLYLIAVIMFVVFALNAVYYVRQRVD